MHAHRDLTTLLIENAKNDLLTHIYNDLSASWIEQKLNEESNQVKSTQRSREYLENTFKNLFESEIKPLFLSQIEKMDLPGMLTKFQNRHPWLTLLNNNTANGNLFSINFLKEFMDEKLKSSLKLYVNTWRRFTFYQNKTILDHFIWNPLSTTEVANYIESYPIANIDKFYCTHSQADDYHSFSKYLLEEVSTNKIDSMKRLFGAEDDSANCADYLLNRIDLLRFLSNYNEKEKKADILPDKTFCTKHAPFNLDELKNLTGAQWNYLETILVNVNNDEKNPLWITLHKKEVNRWIVYFPDTNLIKNKEEILSKLKSIKNLNSLDCVNVDYDKNILLNNFKNKSAIAEWHAVLLGRILPWFKHEDIELNNYRPEVPLSLLIQHVQLQSLPIDSKLTLKKYLSNAFKEYGPFTNNSSPLTRLKNHITNPSQAITIFLTDYQHNKLFFEKIAPENILAEFDKGLLQIRENNLLINAEDSYTLIYGIYLAYHYSELSKIIIHYGTNNLNKANESELQITSAIIKELFDCDTNVKHVTSTNNKKDVYFIHCAARNVFLSIVAVNELSNSKKYVNDRKKLWATAGLKMLHFFKDQMKFTEAGWIDQLLSENKKQKEQYDISTTEIEKLDLMQKRNVAFSYFTKMGSTGLDKLFDTLIQIHLAKKLDDPTFAPQLDGIFDIRGNDITSSVEYVKHLTINIQKFSENCERNAPLFRSLSLVLPDPLNQENIEALFNLLFLLNERKIKFPNELHEINLYNLNNPAAHQLFLETLNVFHEKNPHFQLQINIPTWNETVYLDRDDQIQKAQYRSLQNTISTRQKIVNDKKLSTNQHYLEDYCDGKIDSAITFEKKSKLPEQYWDDQDEKYPLSSKTLGIQQQVQQQQQQQAQQQEQMSQQVAQNQEQMQVQNMDVYSKKEMDLITRENINQKCQHLWDAIPDETKAYSGILPGQTLSDLFSLWVGSNLDAEHVIQKIEPAAVKKMMEHASQFRFGISKVAGFSLALSPEDKTIILCYDEKLEKQILLTQEKGGEKDPFAVVLHSSEIPNEFRGDFRSLSYFSEKNENENNSVLPQTFWRYLATEKLVAANIQDGKNYIKKKCSDEIIKKIQTKSDSSAIISTIMQEVDRSSQFSMPKEFNDCLQDLTKWVKHLGIINTDFINVLFDPTSKTVLTVQNLKALGHLFNHYSIDDFNSNSTSSKTLTVQSAGQQIFFLIYEMWKTFDPYFDIWKKRFLDTSKNWAELLDEKEVVAIVSSLATLKSKTYQAIWWELVNAHGEAIGGKIRYADLWYAFVKILTLIENKKLNIGTDNFLDTLIQYLSKTKNFNAQVFLDRLYQVLVKASNEPNACVIQQSILDNIDKIDWRHNGFYYASIYDNYPYWDETLQLENFNSLTTISLSYDSKHNYQAKWSVGRNHSLTDPISQALRFASQRMHLDIVEFDQLKDILYGFNFNDEEKFKNGLILRLLIACLAIGVDELGQFKNTNIQETVNKLSQLDVKILNTFNEYLYLDTRLITDTFTVKFADMPTLFQCINEEILSLSNIFNNLSDPQVLSFLNACAHARLMLNADDNIYKLLCRRLKQIKLNPQDDLILMECPWLLNHQEIELDKLLSLNKKQSDNNEIRLFKAQLRSIDFTQSNYLPTIEELETYFSSIDSAESRRNIVSKLIDCGCKITIQDLAFRTLSKKEIKEATQFLEENLNPYFKKQNFTLCKRLLETLAIKSEEQNPQATIRDLLNTFIKIDNKPHFDELGRVIGMLLSKIEQSSHYSSSQLNEWLNSLMGKSYNINRHYPTYLLNEIICQPSSLLNNNLNDLQQNIPSEMREAQSVIDIINSETLPAQCKSSLVKLIIEAPANISFVKQAINFITLQPGKPNVDWINAIDKLIRWLGSDHEYREKILSLLQNTLAGTSEENRELLYKSQIKLIDLWIEQEPDKDSFIGLLTFLNHKPNIQIILSHIHIGKDKDRKRVNWTSNDDISLVNQLVDKLTKLDETELNEMAKRAHKDPFPSIEVLNRLLDNLIAGQFDHSDKKVDDLLEYFESVEQVKDAAGENKYSYHITSEENKNLKRILNGLKVKGVGYLPNHDQKALLNLLYYSNHVGSSTHLHTLSSKGLQQALYHALNDFVKNDMNSLYAAARMLACMRMILLRKTGKWVNHTQMLLLLIGVWKNKNADHDLLYEMQTGEGKSILTLMRTAFLALIGCTIDVFSSKESLSHRDHVEFAPVLDGMGIAHSYITACSSIDIYKTHSDQNGIGAINYATTGNLSLFFLSHYWEDDEFPLLNKAKRVAWLDEIDFLLKKEQTQYNYSTSGAAHEVLYNYDEWVYRATYEYYLTIKDTLPGMREGHPSITRQEHLKGLCEYLQQRISQNVPPKDSTFFQKYFLPALPDKNGVVDTNAILNRDRQLKKLLVAAYVAADLKVDQKFCVPPNKIQKLVASRFACVMSDNEKKEGSTYSDLAHQHLHVRLNHEAAEAGQIPDFFIDPESEIALSQNVHYMINNFYSSREGSSATIGDEFDLALYRNVFGIDEVIKAPTHLPRRMKFLTPIYCSSIEEQAHHLVKLMKAHKRKGPILIACANDAEVKRIYKAIQIEIKNQNLNEDDLFNDFIKDTNDSGYSENEVLLRASATDAVTISSRMGRGTDIKNKNLFIQRTYPASPSEQKQEQGRAARNNAKGKCIDIIDYSIIEKQHQHYQANKKHSDRLKEIYIWQANHLNLKFNKHQNIQSTKWNWIKDSENKEKYLITRSVIQLNQEIKEQSELFLRRKEQLMATLSGEIMNGLKKFLTDNSLHTDPHKLSKKMMFKEGWQICRKQIESAWDARLNGKTEDTDEIYALFTAQANHYWKAFCDSQPDLKLENNCINDLHKKASVIEVEKLKLTTNVNTHKTISFLESTQEKDISFVLDFHQEWLEAAETYKATMIKENNNHDEIYQAIYRGGIEPFYLSLFNANQKHDNQLKQYLFTNLLKVSQSFPAIHAISYDVLAEFIDLLFKQKHQEQLDYYLIELRNILGIDKTVTITKETVETVSNLLKLMTRIAEQKNIESKEDENKINNFINNLIKVVAHKDFWPVVMKQTTYEKLVLLFASNPNITRLLSSHLENENDLRSILIFLLNENSLLKVKHCLTYLTNHYDKIADSFLTKIILNINLDPRRAILNADDLPAPDAFAFLKSPMLERKIWNFLAQRTHFNREECNTFTQLITVMTESEIEKLIALPPMPLMVTTHYLQNHNSNYLVFLNELNKAGWSLNEFLRDRGIVNHVELYSPNPGRENEFNEFMEIIQNMDPISAAVIFKVATKHSLVSLKTIKEIINVDKQYKLSKQVLDTLFSLSIKLNQSIFVDQKNSLEDHWQKVLREKGIEQIYLAAQYLTDNLDKIKINKKNISDKINTLPLALKDILNKDWQKISTASDLSSLLNQAIQFDDFLNKLKVSVNKIEKKINTYSSFFQKKIQSLWENILTKDTVQVLNELDEFEGKLKELKALLDSNDSQFNLSHNLKVDLTLSLQTILKQNNIQSMINETTLICNILHKINILPEELQNTVSPFWQAILNDDKINSKEKINRANALNNTLGQLKLTLDSIDNTTIQLPPSLQTCIINSRTDILKQSDSASMLERARELNNKLNLIKSQVEHIEQKINGLEPQLKICVQSYWQAFLSSENKTIDSISQELTLFEKHTLDRIENVINKIDHQFKHYPSFKIQITQVRNDILAESNKEELLTVADSVHSSLKKTKELLKEISEKVHYFLDQHFEKTIQPLINNILEQNLKGCNPALQILRDKLNILTNIHFTRETSNYRTKIFNLWMKNDIETINQSARTLNHIIDWKFVPISPQQLIEDYLLLFNKNAKNIYDRYEYFLKLMEDPANAKLNLNIGKLLYEEYLMKATLNEKQLSTILMNGRKLNELTEIYPHFGVNITQYFLEKNDLLIVDSPTCLNVLLQKEFHGLDEDSVQELTMLYIQGIILAKEEDLSVNSKGKEREIKSEQKGITEAEWVTAMETLKKIKSLSIKYPNITIDDEEKPSIKIMSSDFTSKYQDISSNKRYIDFINLINRYSGLNGKHQPSINTEMFMTLWGCFTNVKPIIEITLLERIVYFTHKFPEIAVQHGIDKANWIIQNAVKINEFLEIILHPAYSNLNQNQIATMADYYFNYLANQNNSAQGLQHSLDQIGIAQAAVNEIKIRKPKDYFKVNKSNISRETIVQYVTHDLVQVSDQFKKNCQDQYQIELTQLLSSGVTVHDHFQIINQQAREIKNISIHPFKATQANLSHEHVKNINPGELKISIKPARLYLFHQYFSAQQEKYQDFWGTKRTTQADTLFKQLHDKTISGIDNNINREACYENCLSIIQDGQLSILEEDYKHNTTSYFKKNTKGFSRLYDICNDMFLVVVDKYLLDNNISQANKNIFFEELMKKHLSTHIATLMNYLTNNTLGTVNPAFNTFKTQLTTLFPVQGKKHKSEDITTLLTVANLITLDKQITNTLQNINTIPKHLVYLIRNLAHLIDLSNGAAPTRTSTKQLKM